MSNNHILADKQLQFILESNKKINLAHGAVRTGKTVGSGFRFMQAVDSCPDSQKMCIRDRSLYSDASPGNEIALNMYNHHLCPLTLGSFPKDLHQ